MTEDLKQTCINIFSRFQNLNLAFLIEDLRQGLVARGSWSVVLDIFDSKNTILCPIAHGLTNEESLNAISE